MPRYKLTIEYDGGAFHGWQIQADADSVQGVMRAAIERFCGESVVVHGAGRTDSGVHALGQVAHVDLSRAADPGTLRDGVNFHLLPHPVAIREAAPVADDFDARFSAVRRHYLYRIINRRAPLTVEKNRAWRVTRPLDADAMHDAAACLAGTHDFTTFRSAHCQATSPVKTLESIAVRRDGETITLSCSARSFLHTQVRAIAGSVKQVGEGVWSADMLRRALEARDRIACAPLAPPHGLYLLRVDYPDAADQPAK